MQVEFELQLLALAEAHSSISKHKIIIYDHYIILWEKQIIRHMADIANKRFEYCFILLVNKKMKIPYYNVIVFINTLASQQFFRLFLLVEF